MKVLFSQPDPGIVSVWETILAVAALLWLGCVLAVLAGWTLMLSARGLRALRDRAHR